MYGKNFSYAQVMAITAKEKEKDKHRYTFEERREKDDEITIHLNPSTIKKLKALGRSWKSKLSAKVEEWVNQETL